MESAQNNPYHHILANSCNDLVTIFCGIECLERFSGQAYSMQTCVVLFHAAFLALICSLICSSSLLVAHYNGPLLCVLCPLMLLFVEEKLSRKDGRTC